MNWKNLPFARLIDEPDDTDMDSSPDPSPTTQLLIDFIHGDSEEQTDCEWPYTPTLTESLYESLYMRPEEAREFTGTITITSQGPDKQVDLEYDRGKLASVSYTGDKK